MKEKIIIALVSFFVGVLLTTTIFGVFLAVTSNRNRNGFIGMNNMPQIQDNRSNNNNNRFRGQMPGNNDNNTQEKQESTSA